MQSDERVSRALEALRTSIEQYRAPIAGTRAQMTDYLAAHREQTAGRADLAATALGRFAGGRLDPNRFASAFEGVRVLTDEDTSRISRCVDTLDSLTEAGDSFFFREVSSGEDLEAAVDSALSNVGRAFGAALAFQAVKTQVFRETTHLPLLEAFPFDRWNRLERFVAPPLVVSVDGKDFDAARVARFLDGRVRLVFVIRGAIAPAALVSLITPAVLVMQTTDEGDVVRMTQSRGPAVVAIVDDTAARFTHDPARGSRLVDRLRVDATPAEAPQRSIGRLSAAQQREQLAQLETLVAASRAESQASATQAMEVAGSAAAAAGARQGTDAVDTLAGWLLNQASIGEQATQ